MLVDVNVFGLPLEFPGHTDLQSGIDELRTHLAGSDSRFDADRHLYVRFFDLTNTVRARWYEGKLALT